MSPFANKMSLACGETPLFSKYASDNENQVAGSRSLVDLLPGTARAKGCEACAGPPSRRRCPCCRRRHPRHGRRRRRPRGPCRRPGRASGTAAAPPGASPCRRRSRAGRHARSGLSLASHGAAGGGAAGGVGPWPAADVANAPRSSRPPPLCRRRRGDPRPSPRHVALAHGVPPFGGRPRQARSGRPPRRHVGGPPPSPSAAAVPSVPVVVTLFTPVRRSRSRSPPRPPHSPPPRPGGVRLHRATPQPIRTPSHPSSLPPSSSRAESEQRAEMPRAISPWPDRR
jgi:hypothetical protein